MAVIIKCKALTPENTVAYHSTKCYPRQKRHMQAAATTQKNDNFVPTIRSTACL